MEQISLYGGIGSCIIAGICYATYRSRENLVKYLKETRRFEGGQELLDAVKEAPNQVLDYVAIRGDAKPLQSPIHSNYVPKAKILIQRILLHEHKAEWSKTSGQWYDTRRTINEVVNSVPFSLNFPGSKIKVAVEEPLSASGLEYNMIYDKYEPINASVSENIVQWASGEKSKGIQTVENALLDSTTLTAVGHVKLLSNGSLVVGPPVDSREYFLTKLPLDGLIRTKKSKAWKYATIFFTVTGGLLLLFWLYKKWRRRQEEMAVHFNVNDDPMDGDNVATDEEQACVVCLTRRRNVVILDCGHICVCRVCATQVNTCPVCRAQIVRLVPTYHS